MKKLAIILTMCLTGFSCTDFDSLKESVEEQLDSLTTFDLDYSTQVEIPASTGINIPLIFPTPETQTNTESEFSINNTRKELVEEVLIEELSLTIKSPEQADFSFLKSITIHLKAEGLDPVKVAWKDNIPEDSQKITLEISDQDLKDFILKDSFKLEVETVTDETINEKHVIGIFSKFKVNAKIAGV